MRSGLIPVLFLGICACGPSQAEFAARSQSPDLSVAVATLRRNLLATHATFDQAAITGLRQTTRCEAVITTLRGLMPVRWKDLGNLIERLQDGRRIFYVSFGGRPHTISVRNGVSADNIGAGLSLLDEECGGVRPGAGD